MYPAIIDKALFKRVQERLAKNRYFAGGTATARVPYLLAGKAKCLHSFSDMIAGGGTSKTGKQYNYYECKSKKKKLCHKRNEGKDFLEQHAVENVREFLSDPMNVEIAVTDTLNHCDRRTSEESLKSLESKIAHTQREIEEMADAFVKAKNQLLQNAIEKKMDNQEKLLDELLTQKAQLELERGDKLTKAEILEFIADLLKGDPADKEYQKKIIDRLVDLVLVGDDDIIVELNLHGNNKIMNERQIADLSGLRDAAEQAKRVQTQLPPVRQLFDKKS